ARYSSASAASRRVSAAAWWPHRVATSPFRSLAARPTAPGSSRPSPIRAVVVQAGRWSLVALLERNATHVAVLALGGLLKRLSRIVATVATGILHDVHNLRVHVQRCSCLVVTVLVFARLQCANDNHLRTLAKAAGLRQCREPFRRAPPCGTS